MVRRKWKRADGRITDFESVNHNCRYVQWELWDESYETCEIKKWFKLSIAEFLKLRIAWETREIPPEF